MPTRRVLLLAAPAWLTAGRAGAAPALTDDGLYTQPWFLESFLVLAEDVAAAAARGKRLAVMWELRGCPYCRETHLVNLARPDIEAYVRERFEVLQLNVLGAREVTDLDGERLPENRVAAKYGVRFTPTIQFFPESTEGLRDRAPMRREVARAQGYLQPDHFLAMFRFVAEKAYERGTFRDYLRKPGG
jgi:thioredoxin-related protein